MKKRLTDNEFHTKESKERACYIQEPRLQAIYDKLFELEDIEEELGVELTTLVNALKNGVWCKYSLDWECNVQLHFSDFFEDFCFEDYKGNVYLLKEYGKTWSLNKEDLLCH